MFSWLQHCNQQSVVPQTSPNTILPQTSQDTFQNEIEKSTKYAEHQPNSTNHFELQSDYVSCDISDNLKPKTSYHYGNHSTVNPGILKKASPSGSSKTSNYSRTSYNLSSRVYDSPQTDPSCSPLSYQQNRYQFYVSPTQTAPQANNFTGTFLYNDNPLDMLHYQQA